MTPDSQRCGHGALAVAELPFAAPATLRNLRHEDNLFARKRSSTKHQVQSFPVLLSRMCPPTPDRTTKISRLEIRIEAHS